MLVVRYTMLIACLYRARGFEDAIEVDTDVLLILFDSSALDECDQRR